MAARRPKQLLYSLTHTCSVGAVCAAVCAGAGVCGAYRTRLKQRKLHRGCTVCDKGYVDVLQKLRAPGARFRSVAYAHALARLAIRDTISRKDAVLTLAHASPVCEGREP